MRWQDALIGDAKRNFTDYLEEQRRIAIARLLNEADRDEVLRLQARTRVLDEIQAELTRKERDEAADADYRQRVRGDRPGTSGA